MNRYIGVIRQRFRHRANRLVHLLRQTAHDAEAGVFVLRRGAVAVTLLPHRERHDSVLESGISQPVARIAEHVHIEQRLPFSERGSARVFRTVDGSPVIRRRAVAVVKLFQRSADRIILRVRHHQSRNALCILLHDLHTERNQEAVRRG